MAPLRIFLLLSLLGSVALASGGGDRCASTIRIDAPKPEYKRLRALLVKSSLAELNATDCAPYVVRLVPTTPDGYVLTLSDTTNGMKRTRQVSSLAYASTWLEAWSQSGFAALEEGEESNVELKEPRPTTSPMVGAAALDSNGRSRSSETPKPESTDEYSREGASFSLKGGPMVLVTELGNGLIGGQLALMHRGKSAVEVGVGSGFVTQFSPGNVSRRLYWVGPEFGLEYRLGHGFSMTPSFGVGILGTSAIASGTATALGGYASFGHLLAWRLSSKLSTYVGAELMLVSAKLLGSSSSGAVSTESEDGETEIEFSSTTLEPSPGAVNAGLRFGVTWDLGGLT